MSVRKWIGSNVVFTLFVTFIFTFFICFSTVNENAFFVCSKQQIDTDCVCEREAW